MELKKRDLLVTIHKDKIRFLSLDKDKIDILEDFELPGLSLCEDTTFTSTIATHVSTFIASRDLKRSQIDFVIPIQKIFFFTFHVPRVEAQYQQQVIAYEVEKKFQEEGLDLIWKIESDTQLEVENIYQVFGVKCELLSLLHKAFAHKGLQLRYICTEPSLFILGFRKWLNQHSLNSASFLFLETGYWILGYVEKNMCLLQKTYIDNEEKFYLQEKILHDIKKMDYVCWCLEKTDALKHIHILKNYEDNTLLEYLKEKIPNFHANLNLSFEKCIQQGYLKNKEQLNTLSFNQDNFFNTKSRKNCNKYSPLLKKITLVCIFAQIGLLGYYGYAIDHCKTKISALKERKGYLSLKAKETMKAQEKIAQLKESFLIFEKRDNLQKQWIYFFESFQNYFSQHPYWTLESIQYENNALYSEKQIKNYYYICFILTENDEVKVINAVSQLESLLKSISCIAEVSHLKVEPKDEHSLKVGCKIYFKNEA